MPDTLLPSAEALLGTWLRAQPSISAIVGARVGKTIGTMYPAIRLSRVAGRPTQRWEDSPECQIECWADLPETAELLARTVVAALPGINGPHAGGYVSGWDITLGPIWSPDPVSNRPRYLLGLLLRTYA